MSRRRGIIVPHDISQDREDCISGGRVTFTQGLCPCTLRAPADTLDLGGHLLFPPHMGKKKEFGEGLKHLPSSAHLGCGPGDVGLPWVGGGGGGDAHSLVT